jgi:hypothetical protein
MMAVVQVSARAICGNCRFPLLKGLRVEERSERWWHEVNGLAHCPGAPMANPVEDTVQHLAHEPD